MSLATILQATVGGFLLGGIYALLSAGLTLIFGVMRVINFAQAEFMMVGMFAAYVLATSFRIDPLILALPVGGGLALLGWIIAAGLLERMPRGDHNAQLILTLGVSLVFQNLMLIGFGPTPRPVVRPYTNSYWTPAGLSSTRRDCLRASLRCCSWSDFITFIRTGPAGQCAPPQTIRSRPPVSA